MRAFLRRLAGSKGALFPFGNVRAAIAIQYSSPLQPHARRGPRRQTPMPDCTKYDMGFRPRMDWDDPVRRSFSRIKGSLRRKAVLEEIRKKGFGNLDRSILRPGLTGEERQRLMRIHPSLSGGEYLPDHRGGELEIVRVTLASTLGDVISVRARRDNKGIHYRVMDEYENPIKVQARLRRSGKPLTMGQLVELIDTMRHPDCGSNLLTGILDSNLDGQDPEELRRFVTVTSSYDPQIEAYYRDVVDDWILARRADQAMDDVFEGFESEALERVFGEKEYPSAVTDLRDLGLLRREATRLWRTTRQPRVLLELLKGVPAVHDSRLLRLACVCARGSACFRAEPFRQFLRIAEMRAAGKETKEDLEQAWQPLESRAPGYARGPTAWHVSKKLYLALGGQQLRGWDVPTSLDVAETAIQFIGETPKGVIVAMRELLGSPLEERGLTRGIARSPAAVFANASDPIVIIALLARRRYADLAVISRFALWCASQVQHLMGPESRRLLETVGSKDSSPRERQRALVKAAEELENERECAGDAPAAAAATKAALSLISESPWVAAWRASRHAARAAIPGGLDVRAHQANKLRELVGAWPSRVADCGSPDRKHPGKRRFSDPVRSPTR